MDRTMVLNLFEKNQITGQKTTSSFVDSLQKTAGSLRFWNNWDQQFFINSNTHTTLEWTTA